MLKGINIVEDHISIVYSIKKVTTGQIQCFSQIYIHVIC